MYSEAVTIRTLSDDQMKEIIFNRSREEILSVFRTLNFDNGALMMEIKRIRKENEVLVNQLKMEKERRSSMQGLRGRRR